jgi:hypothetical protein
MATKTTGKTTTKKTTAQKKVVADTVEGLETSAPTDEMTSSDESLDMAENKTPVEPELPPLTEEEITAQKELLEKGIELAMEWFEYGQDANAFEAMSEKEQALTRLLDPMAWMMREALISYTERSGGCEECTVRVESRNNELQLSIADMLLMSRGSDG